MLGKSIQNASEHHAAANFKCGVQHSLYLASDLVAQTHENQEGITETFTELMPAVQSSKFVVQEAGKAEDKVRMRIRGINVELQQTTHRVSHQAEHP